MGQQGNTRERMNKRERERSRRRGNSNLQVRRLDYKGFMTIENITARDGRLIYN